MSWLSWLNPLKLVTQAVGSGMEGYSQAKAQQRAGSEQMEMDREVRRQAGERTYLDALSQREKDRKSSTDDAWKRLQQYDYINSGGTKTPMVSPYSRPVQGPGALAQEAAQDQGIIHELIQRASWGDPYNPSNPSQTAYELNRARLPGSDQAGDVYGRMTDNMKPGTLENVFGWLGAGLKGLGGSDTGTVRQQRGIFQETDNPRPR